VRGDATLQARLLLRATGVAGASVAVGGVLALVGAYRPWYAVRAELTMLDDDQASALAELAGWQAHPWGWIVPALGVVAVALGVAMALDRPPARSRQVLVASGALLAVAALVGWQLRPEVRRFDIAGSRLREWLDLAERMPAGVELDFSVTVADGVWVTLVAAVVVVLGALAARELPR
jgi:cytochrome bd-type quinol oxidase subunit 2